MKAKRFARTPFGALKCLEAVAACGTKRLPKEALLKRNKGNKYLQELLGWTYSDAKFYAHPDLSDFLKKKKVRAPDDSTGLTNYNDFIQLLHQLSGRKITGAKAMMEIEKFFKRPHLYEIETLWYGRVMAHDLEIGVRDGTIKRIWPKFYHVEAKAGKGTPVYKGIQKPMSEVVGPDFPFKYPVRAEIKKDGFRVTYVSDGGVCTGFTTGGKTYPLLKIFGDVFATKPGWVFDVEIFYGNFNKTGIFKRTKPLKPEELKALKKGATVDIVALIPLKDYYKGESKMKFRKSLAIAKRLVKELNDPRIRVMPGKRIKNAKQLAAYLKKVLAKKHEGLVVKSYDGTYTASIPPARPESWRKLKPQRDRTVIIIGAEESEKTKMKGHLKSFQVRDPETGDEFDCGGSWNDPMTGKSSMTHKKRQWMWKNRKALIGMKIDVIEQEEKKGKRKSMYARFKGWRGKPLPDRLLKEWLKLK